MLGRFSILLSQCVVEKLDKRFILFNQQKCWLKQIICLCVEVHKTKPKLLLLWKCFLFLRSVLYLQDILNYSFACCFAWV
jgi:hypothetical protein